MQYLNVDQALADVANFIDNIKLNKNISHSKVVVFGGSYAGNMATWIRIKYPHLIQVKNLFHPPNFNTRHNQVDHQDLQ